MPICDMCCISTENIIRIKNGIGNTVDLCVRCHQVLHSTANKLKNTNTLNNSKKCKFLVMVDLLKK